MNKPTIKKNLSDAEMFQGFESYEEEVQKKAKAQEKKTPALELDLSSDIQAKFNKALLELKLKMLKDGVKDYKMKVTVQDYNIILSAIPE